MNYILGLGFYSIISLRTFFEEGFYYFHFSKLSEPRENSYIEFNRKSSRCFESSLGAVFKDLGKVKVRRDRAGWWLVVTSCPQTSNTFPSMCRASLETAICNLETIALVQTADLHGNLQVGRETGHLGPVRYRRVAGERRGPGHGGGGHRHGGRHRDERRG